MSIKLSELFSRLISHDSQGFRVLFVCDDMQQAHEFAVLAFKQQTIFCVLRQCNTMQVTLVSAAIVQARNDFLAGVTALV